MDRRSMDCSSAEGVNGLLLPPGPVWAEPGARRPDRSETSRVDAAGRERDGVKGPREWRVRLQLVH